MHDVLVRCGARRFRRLAAALAWDDAGVPVRASRPLEAGLGVVAAAHCLRVAVEMLSAHLSAVRDRVVSCGVTRFRIFASHPQKAIGVRPLGLTFVCVHMCMHVCGVAV